MTDPSKPDENAATGGNPDQRQHAIERRLRVWPAVAIVVAQWVGLAIALSQPTVMASAIGQIGVPALATLLMIIWWLTASRATLREKLAGIALFAAILVSIDLTQSSNGPRMVTVALPVLDTGIAVALVISTRKRIRYWAATAFMLACAAFFPTLRVAGVNGSMAPILAWRWSPSSEDLLTNATRQTSAKLAEKATLPPQAGPEDWPGFRGALRDGRRTGAKFATNWSEHAPRQMWRNRVGLGWSSFAVVGDYIFTQEQRHADELVVCYRADNGDEVWINHVTARFDDATGSGPRATPTFDQGKLYALGATGVLQCLDASSGDTIWKRSLTEDAKTKVPTWGFASSPLVTADLVVVFAGGADGKSVMAYKRSNGEIAWAAGNGTHGYSSGEVERIDDVPQLLMSSNIGIQSFVPETGALLWEHRWPVDTNPRVVQPLVTDGDSVLIGTAAGMGTRRLQIQHTDSKWNVNEKWTTKSFRPYFNDFVFHKGNCYGFDGNRLCCVDAATGDIRWTGKRCGGQALLLADMDMVLILNESGDVVLVQATPDAYHEVAELKVLTGKTWNHPVVAHGKLFVRNDGEAACYELPS